MAGHRITRRRALGAIAATGAGYALLGPRGGDRRDRDGRVVIDYWEKWTGDEGRAMLEIVERFNRHQDRIRVRCVTLAGIGQKALVAIAGGDPPDVLGLWSYNVPAYARSGALRPLEALAGHGVHLDDYVPSLPPLVTDRGAWWAVPNTCGTVALYRNRKLFRDAGLDPDRPPVTTDRLDDVADALTRADRTGRLARAGFLHAEPGWWSWSWGHYFGGRLWDPATGRATAAAAENRAAYAWVQRGPRRWGAAALERLRSTFGNYASPQQSFLAGRTAMVAQGPWLANVIAAFRPDLDYAASPMPVAAAVHDPAAPIALVECDVLVVPARAAHPEAAMEFIAFTQRPAQVEHLARRHAKPSTLRAAATSFRAAHPNRALDVHEAQLRSPRAFSVPPLRAWPFYRDEFNSAFERIWRLEADPADALAAVERRVQARLDLDRRRRAGA